MFHRESRCLHIHKTLHLCKVLVFHLPVYCGQWDIHYHFQLQDNGLPMFSRYLVFYRYGKYYKERKLFLDHYDYYY